MPCLTVEQSKLGAKRSAEAKRERAAELILLRKRVKEFEAALPAKPVVIPSDDYTQARLNRVREQLDRLDRMLMDEDDPQRLDRLVSATSRLEEQERRLSGRFSPGTTKPSTKAARPTWSAPEPIPGPNCGLGQGQTPQEPKP